LQEPDEPDNRLRKMAGRAVKYVALRAKCTSTNQILPVSKRFYRLPSTGVAGSSWEGRVCKTRQRDASQFPGSAGPRPSVCIQRPNFGEKQLLNNPVQLYRFVARGCETMKQASESE